MKRSKRKLMNNANAKANMRLKWALSAICQAPLSMRLRIAWRLIWGKP